MLSESQHEDKELEISGDWESIADIIDRLNNTSSEVFQTSIRLAELENYIEKADPYYLGEMGSSADYIDYDYVPRPKIVYTYFPTY